MRQTELFDLLANHVVGNFYDYTLYNIKDLEDGIFMELFNE